jgi:hypothetical protein
MVAAQLLEATKGVLDHLRTWQTRLSQSGEEGPAGIPQIYGAVRRLRDYLQRLAVSSYTREVPVNLGPDEENLLVSCAVHHIGCIDLELQERTHNPQDAAWLESARQSLSAWAVRLASRPVARIPSPDAVRLNTPTVRAVIAAIARAGAEAAQAKRPRPAAPDARLGGPAAPRLSSPRAVTAAGAPVAPTPLYPTVEPASGAVPPALDIRPGYEFPAAAPVDFAPATAGIDPFAAVAKHAGGGAPVPRAGAGGGPEGIPYVELMLDPRMVRDPRLRTMIAMDLGALERTAAAQQYRLAMVHLASVLEGVVVDHALPRQKQLDIPGLPESWKIERILDKCMGDKLTSMDRPCLLQLVAARHLVRPAVQLNSPMAVTAATLDKAADFVRRVLSALGYTGLGPAVADSFDESLPLFGAPPAKAAELDAPAGGPPAWLQPSPHQ